MKATFLAVALAASAGTADAQFRYGYGSYYTTPYYSAPYYGGYYGGYVTPAAYSTYSPGLSFGFNFGNAGYYPARYYSTPYYPVRYYNGFYGGRGWRRW